MNVFKARGNVGKPSTSVANGLEFDSLFGRIKQGNLSFPADGLKCRSISQQLPLCFLCKSEFKFENIVNTVDQ